MSARGVGVDGRDGLLATDTDRLPSVAEELWSLMKLAGPMFIGRVSWVIMKVTDSAVLGHVGSRYLDNAALSDLWTSSSGVFISFGPTSTFAGQAFGAGNKMLVGIWVQVAMVVLLSTMIPVAILWCLTGPVLRAMGNSETETSDAGYYAMVLALCLPVRIFFSQLSAFFNSQKIVRPSAVCATSSMLMNLCGTLIFVLGFGIPNWSGFGFTACPIVTTCVEYVQFFLLWFVFCFLKQLHKECWPGFSKDHLTRDRICQYVKMYVPSALSIASDFWRVAAIGAIAKTLSAESLGVFNISYRICWICLTFVGSLASSVGIQLNVALGKGSLRDVKQKIAVGIGFSAILLAILGSIMVCIPRTLGGIFSNDPVLLDMFAESRWSMMAFTVLMNFAVCLELVPRAAGRVNAVFYMGLIGSWGGQVPGVILCTQYWRKDLTGLLFGASTGYGLLCILYAGIILKIDWQAVVREAAERSEVSAQQASPKPQQAEEDGISLEPANEENADA